LIFPLDSNKGFGFSFTVTLINPCFAKNAFNTASFFASFSPEISFPNLFLPFHW